MTFIIPAEDLFSFSGETVTWNESRENTSEEHRPALLYLTWDLKRIIQRLFVSEMNKCFIALKTQCMWSFNEDIVGQFFSGALLTEVQISGWRGSGRQPGVCGNDITRCGGALKRNLLSVFLSYFCQTQLIRKRHVTSFLYRTRSKYTLLFLSFGRSLPACSF